MNNDKLETNQDTEEKKVDLSDTNIPEELSEILDGVPSEHRKRVTQMMISAV